MFEAPVRHHSFVEADHETFSAVILSLLLIQEGKLSVTCVDIKQQQQQQQYNNNMYRTVGSADINRRVGIIVGTYTPLFNLSFLTMLCLKQFSTVTLYQKRRHQRIIKNNNSV